MTGCALQYVVANYNLQLESIRPRLVALGASMTINGPQAEIDFQWNNSSRGTLREGMADLFTSVDGTWQKLGRTALDRVATNIPGGMGAGSHFSVESAKVRDRTLRLASANHGSTKYQQAFLFRPHPGPSEHGALLQELPNPDKDACRKVE